MSDIEREILESKARLCLDCGKCTVVCPVAQDDPEFNPRLITQRRLGAKHDDYLDSSIWSCISCYMCVERCNYHVDFPEFIGAMRHEACLEGHQVKCSHGGALQSMMHMMARPEIRQDRLDWLPPDVVVSRDSTTLFFVGCAPYLDVVFADLGVSTADGAVGALRLLNRAGIPFTLLENERCCGHDLLQQGDRSGFAALARANLREFAAHGIKRIITHCPEGLHALRVSYPRFLGETGLEVVHLTEVLSPLVQSHQLQLGKLDQTVTYHDPCMLGRYGRLFEEPRALLKAVGGLELVEMEQTKETALCCGSAPWAHCGAVNRQVQERLLAQARDTQADVMVTACPKCQIHLRCLQKVGGDIVPDIKLWDMADLLAKSLDEEVT